MLVKKKKFIITIAINVYSIKLFNTTTKFIDKTNLEEFCYVNLFMK